MTLSASSAINPQTLFGADVISRISYTEDDPHKLSELQKAVTKQINSLIKQVFSKTGRKPSEKTALQSQETPPWNTSLRAYHLRA